MYIGIFTIKYNINHKYSSKWIIYIHSNSVCGWIRTTGTLPHTSLAGRHHSGADKPTGSYLSFKR